MKKNDVVAKMINEKNHTPLKSSGPQFAPTNIALCKYWGKRNQELNLPVTSSFSISLGHKGTTTEIKPSESQEDVVLLNNEKVAETTDFYKRLVKFLALFPAHEKMKFVINTQTNIPTAAGLASSASGFAALVLALDKLFAWQLSERNLSILARLGSGSASRSLWQGFVEWHAGVKEDGSDSFSEPFSEIWPDFAIGLLILSSKEKYISSRVAMQRTVETCPFYSLWPNKVNSDLIEIKQAIQAKDFDLLGRIAESDAMAMHATMLSAWPPVCYALPETILAMQQIWKLREQGLSLYFTQDAGPNIKLLFLKKDSEQIKKHFPAVEILYPFQK